MRGCTDMNDCGSIKIPMNEYVEVAKFKENACKTFTRANFSR